MKLLKFFRTSHNNIEENLIPDLGMRFFFYSYQKLRSDFTNAGLILDELTT